MSYTLGDIHNTGTGINIQDLLMYKGIWSNASPAYKLPALQYALLNVTQEEPFSSGYTTSGLLYLKGLWSLQLPQVAIEFTSPFDLTNGGKGTQVAAFGNMYIATEPDASATYFFKGSVATVGTGHSGVYERVGDAIDPGPAVEPPLQLLRNRSFTSLEFGLRSVAIHGNLVAVSALYDDNTGVAYVYGKDGSIFPLNHEITIPGCTNAPKVDLNSEYLFVSNPTEGKVRIYKLADLPEASAAASIDITPHQILESTTNESLGFGCDISALDDKLIIGHENGDVSGTNCGYADVYEKSGDAWAKSRQLIPDDILSNTSTSSLVQRPFINALTFCTSLHADDAMNGEWAYDNQEKFGKPVWKNAGKFIVWRPNCSPFAIVNGMPTIPVYPSTKLILTIGNECISEYKFKLSSLPSHSMICVKKDGLTDDQMAGEYRYSGMESGGKNYWSGPREVHFKDNKWHIGWVSDPTGDQPVSSTDNNVVEFPWQATWPAGWTVTLENCEGKSILDWSDAKPVAEALSLPGDVAEDMNGFSSWEHLGNYTLYVIGKNTSGLWQDENEATEVTWEVIENTAPVTIVSATSIVDDPVFGQIPLVHTIIPVAGEQDVYQLESSFYWDEELTLVFGGQNVVRYSWKKTWESNDWVPDQTGVEVGTPLTLGDFPTDGTWEPGAKVLKVVGINASGNFDASKAITLQFRITKRVPTEAHCDPFYTVANNDVSCSPLVNDPMPDPWWDASVNYGKNDYVSWWSDTQGTVGTYRCRKNLVFNHEPRESLVGGDDYVDFFNQGQTAPWELVCECECEVDNALALTACDAQQIVLPAADESSLDSVTHDDQPESGQWVVVTTVDADTSADEIAHQFAFSDQSIPQSPWLVNWPSMTVEVGECDDDQACSEGYHLEWLKAGEPCTEGDTGCVEECVEDYPGGGTDISYGASVTLTDSVALVGAPRSWATTPDRREGAVYVCNPNTGDLLQKLEHDDSVTDSQSAEGSFEFGRSAVIDDDLSIWVVENIPGQGTYVVPHDKNGFTWTATTSYKITDDLVGGSLAYGDAVVFGAPGYFEGFINDNGETVETGEICPEGYALECNTDNPPAVQSCDLCSDTASAHKTAISKLKSEDIDAIVADSGYEGMVHEIAQDLANECGLSNWQKETLTKMINHWLREGFADVDDWKDLAVEHPDFATLLMQVAMKGADFFVEFMESLDGLYDDINQSEWMNIDFLIENCKEENGGICPPEALAKIQAMDVDGDGQVDSCADLFGEWDFDDAKQGILDVKASVLEVCQDIESATWLKKAYVTVNLGTKQVNELNAIWKAVRAEWIESGEEWPHTGWVNWKNPPKNAVSATEDMCAFWVGRLDRMLEILNALEQQYKNYRNTTCENDAYYDSSGSPVYFLDGEPDCECADQQITSGSDDSTSVDSTLFDPHTFKYPGRLYSKRPTNTSGEVGDIDRDRLQTPKYPGKNK